jgi:hypothetical protein
MAERPGPPYLTLVEPPKPKPAEYPELGGPLLDITATIESPIPDVEWAVEDLIAADDIVLLSGPGGLGKTYILMALAIALATGRPLFGFFNVLKQFNVLYVDEEMAASEVTRRFSRMLKGQHFLSPAEYPLNLHIMPQGRIRFDGSQKHHGTLKQLIEEHQIEVLLIDSVRRTIAGNENDSAVANLFFSEVKPLRDAYGLMCGLIGHWNKDSVDSAELTVNARFRGSTDWINLCDSHVAVLKGPGEHRLILEHGKSRHELPLPPFGIRFAHDDPDDPNTPFWLEHEGQAQATSDQEVVLGLACRLGRITRKDTEVLKEIPPKRRRLALLNLVKAKRLHIVEKRVHGEHVYQP